MSEESSNKPAVPPLSRRHMFVGAGTAGALAAVAAVMPRSLPELPAEVAEAVATKAEGYQLTEHVKRYYATARV